MSKHRRGPDNAAVDADGFHRVHRLTPLLQFWSVILAILAIGVVNINLEVLGDAARFIADGHWGRGLRDAAWTAAAFIGICLAIWFLSAIWWRRLGYRLGTDELALRRGVLSTQLRTARYDRIQAVDVIEPVIARIFGVAAVRVETAGGASSHIQIAYLNKPAATQLREEILTRTSGCRPPTGAEPAAANDAAHQEVVIPPIPTRRSLLGAALRLSTLLVVVIAAVLVLTPVPKTTVVPILVGLVPNVWGLIDTSWRFSSRLDEDDSGRALLIINYGLADRRHQSVRLDRIHAVQVRQPLLWRLTKWWEVRVSVAGYGSAAGKGSGTTRVLPVGSREQALRLLELLSPLDKKEIDRYAQPEGAREPTYSSPRRAWWVSPLDSHRQAVTLVGGNSITHAGLLNRRVSVIANSHIQELAYTAGPIAQLCRLATVRYELVAGPVRMAGSDLDPADAAALLSHLRARRLPTAPSANAKDDPDPA
ncbi:PH domain-containing protein [uncultured Corynebacterium sp.]|uniref:PH domain-containing protein n=1 Tax=uncultured Corynebacterium sp. TaxID=159447 RepID=UPI0025E09502|nr:PH domain-containing protein [uncultured Corynebacterium sp.]